MAKPMTMTIEVEEIAFGAVFRKLDAMPGVVAINIRGTGPRTGEPTLGEPEAPKRMGTTSRGRRADGNTSGCVILRTLIARDPTVVSNKDLEAAMIAAGKQAKTLYGALHSLRTSKKIKSTDDGSIVTPLGKKFYAEKCTPQVTTEKE